MTDSQSFELNAVQLNSIAKVGDKIKLLVGQQTQDTMVYAEVLVSAPLLASAVPTVVFNGPLESTVGTMVYALWLETADGKDSTTSKFETVS